MASAESSTDTAKLCTRAEVAKHNDSEDCWVIIHNAIYDLTPFLTEHPGGEEVLLFWAGQDATEAFEDVGHSSDARQMMERYRVDFLVLEEQNVTTKEEKKHKDRAEGSLGDDDSSGSWRSWLIPVALGVLATLVYRYFLAVR